MGHNKIPGMTMEVAMTCINFLARRREKDIFTTWPRRYEEIRKVGGQKGAESPSRWSG